MFSSLPIPNIAGITSTGIEKKVREATHDDGWRPPEKLLIDIANASHSYKDLPVIMSIIWKRLSDHTKNWKRLYKALILVDYLLKKGSDQVSYEVSVRRSEIQTLTMFQHGGSFDGKDIGVHVRDKAKAILEYLDAREQGKTQAQIVAQIQVQASTQAQPQVQTQTQTQVQTQTTQVQVQTTGAPPVLPPKPVVNQPTFAEQHAMNNPFQHPQYQQPVYNQPQTFDPHNNNFQHQVQGQVVMTNVQPSVTVGIQHQQQHQLQHQHQQPPQYAQVDDPFALPPGYTANQNYH
eukprot:TRINITY_DN215_c0_g6_i1.p1 TRINITY_DN215_c0_g6~~TRINITY_DN215_c0_g6_i1.p1  ORF type:complete len:291 (-),score=140.16 TRINITY_DN215_c0_g6_i1:133-1005(-)